MTALLRNAESPALRTAASSALGQMGKAGIPPLLEQLHNPSVDARREAAAHLGDEIKSTPVLKALSIALKDSDAQVRCNAARG